MKTARISFFSLLKNIFKKIWMYFTAFLVRELRTIKKSIFEKIPKRPKKSRFSKKEVRFLWDVSDRLHKIDIAKKWDSFLRGTQKSAFLLHTKHFFRVFEKCPKMAFFGVFLKKFSLHSYREIHQKHHGERFFLEALFIKVPKTFGVNFQKWTFLKCPKMKTTRISFFSLLKKYFDFP